MRTPRLMVLYHFLIFFLGHTSRSKIGSLLRNWTYLLKESWFVESKSSCRDSCHTNNWVFSTALATPKSLHYDNNYWEVFSAQKNVRFSLLTFLQINILRSSISSRSPAISRTCRTVYGVYAYSLHRGQIFPLCSYRSDLAPEYSKRTATLARHDQDLRVQDNWGGELIVW